jgi:hypothetical protein
VLACMVRESAKFSAAAATLMRTAFGARCGGGSRLSASGPALLSGSLAGSPSLSTTRERIVRSLSIVQNILTH